MIKHFIFACKSLTKYIFIIPIFLTISYSIFTIKSLFQLIVFSDILILPGSELFSMRDAMFTVSPQISYANFFVPTTQLQLVQN
jgi:hypothetical protein